MTVRAPKPILFTPGPVRLPPAVTLAFVDPPCNYHRQEAFRALFAQNEHDLKALLGVRRGGDFHAVVLTTTGTGANEAALQTLAALGPGVIVSNGFFGARLVEQAHATGVAHVVHEAPADRPIDVAEVARTVRRHPGLAWLYFVAHETRSGLANPVAALGRAGRDHGLVVAADVVSHAFALPLDLEADGIDLAVASSAKGLMSVPGLGIVVARNELLARAYALPRRAYYLDLPAEWAKQRAEMQPRFAQPVALHAALAAACQHLTTTGIDAHQRRINRQLRALTAHLAARGVRAPLPEAFRSNVAVNFTLPSHLPYSTFAQRLEEQGFYALYGIPGDPSQFQLSTMGDLTDEHVAALAAALDRVLGLEEARS